MNRRLDDNLSKILIELDAWMIFPYTYFYTLFFVHQLKIIKKIIVEFVLLVESRNQSYFLRINLDGGEPNQFSFFTQHVAGQLYSHWVMASYSVGWLPNFGMWQIEARAFQLLPQVFLVIHTFLDSNNGSSLVRKCCMRLFLGYTTIESW